MTEVAANSAEPSSVAPTAGTAAAGSAAASPAAPTACSAAVISSRAAGAGGGEVGGFSQWGSGNIACPKIPKLGSGRPSPARTHSVCRKQFRETANLAAACFAIPKAEEMSGEPKKKRRKTEGEVEGREQRRLRFKIGLAGWRAGRVGAWC